MAQLVDELTKILEKAPRSADGTIVQWYTHGSKRTRGLTNYLVESKAWMILARLERLNPALKFELGDLEIAMHRALMSGPNSPQISILN